MFCQSSCSSAGAFKYSGNVETQTSLFNLLLLKKEVSALLHFIFIIHFIVQNYEGGCEMMGG